MVIQAFGVQFSGTIDVAGFPRGSDTSKSKIDGGSGGYVFINCTNIATCHLIDGSTITANGGYG